MGHRCDATPRTVADLIAVLTTFDPERLVFETWDEKAGWVDVGEDGVLWIGVHQPCSREDNPDRVSEQTIEDQVVRARDQLAVKIREEISKGVHSTTSQRDWITKLIMHRVLGQNWDG